MAVADEFFDFSADASQVQPAAPPEETSTGDEFFGLPGDPPPAPEAEPERHGAPGEAMSPALFFDDEPGPGTTREEPPAPAVDEDDVERKSPSGKARPAGEKIVDEGRLARMVREVGTLEDEIVAKLDAAERLFVQLEARKTHEDAGYLSAEEFEQRVLATTPSLGAMRQASPRPAAPHPAKTGGAKRDASDVRARRTKALTAIARAIERIRAIDTEIRAAAKQARAVLFKIERMRVYEECGYLSFEEFQERVLGPSAILQSALALVAEPPPLDSVRSSTDDGGWTDVSTEVTTVDPSAHPAAPPDVPFEDGFGSTVAPAPESTSTSSDSSVFGDFFAPLPPPPAAAPAPVASEPKETPRGEASAEGGAAKPAEAAPEKAPSRGRGRLIASIVLCAVGAIGGSLAGILSGHFAPHRAQAAAEVEGGGPEPAASASVSHLEGVTENRRLAGAAGEELLPNKSHERAGRLPSGQPSSEKSAEIEGKKAPH